MELENQEDSQIFIQTVTWQKDNHSLFDYESSKVSRTNLAVPRNSKSITLYRSLLTQQILAKLDQDLINIDKSHLILTHFKIEEATQLGNKKNRLNLRNDMKRTLKIVANSEIPVNERHYEEKMYLIVKQVKDIYGEQKGYKLHAGQTIKIGRVQFYVSQVFTNGNLSISPSKSSHNSKIMTINLQSKEQSQKYACRICLDQIQNQRKGYLFNPCLCRGSSGSLHTMCLRQWMQYKVKKQVIGGTLHYNFDKFECEICKSELPMIIDKGGQLFELLPIEKPQRNYIILEGACARSKSLIIIHNTPPEGIKLGRGHQCQIKITDISISRKHAIIRCINGHFYLFDTSSKFGTLVRKDNMSINIGTQPCSFQVGRTTLSIQLKNKEQLNSQI